MAGKPVVIYKSTAVTFWDFFNNPMVAALDSTWRPIADVCKLREAFGASDDPPAGKDSSTHPHRTFRRPTTSERTSRRISGR